MSGGDFGEPLRVARHGKQATLSTGNGYIIATYQPQGDLDLTPVIERLAVCTTALDGVENPAEQVAQWKAMQALNPSRWREIEQMLPHQIDRLAREWESS